MEYTVFRFHRRVRTYNVVIITSGLVNLSRATSLESRDDAKARACFRPVSSCSCASHSNRETRCCRGGRKLQLVLFPFDIFSSYAHGRVLRHRFAEDRSKCFIFTRIRNSYTVVGRRCPDSAANARRNSRDSWRARSLLIAQTRRRA